MVLKSSSVLTQQYNDTARIKYELRDLMLFNKRKGPSETVEDFLARGGEIKTYAYKKPPAWAPTFNGQCKTPRGWRRHTKK